MSCSVAIEFLEHRVVVAAEKAGVTERVARSFSEMLAPDLSRGHEVLEVRRNGRAHELLRDGIQVVSDPALSEVQRALRHEIIGSFVRARPELLWLHAGAAVRNGRAVLFVGPYGRGKSTVVTQLCARGWRYASDDIVPVDLSTGRILPFPLTPVVRQDVGKELPRERLTELRKVKVSLPRSAFHREPVPIGGIVLPSYRTGARARLEPYSPAAVALDIVREGINREQHGEATVVLCARLVSELPVLRLVFSDAQAAADLVIRELEDHRALVPEQETGVLQFAT